MSAPDAAPRPERIVDAHVHLWDLTSHRAWYPALEAPEGDAHDVGLGEMAGIRRDYRLAEYRADAEGHRVTGVVHVSAVSAAGVHHDEARWLDELADREGVPSALIGTVDPTDDAATIVADLERQAASPRFRGARVLYGLEPDSAAAGVVLEWLEQHGYVLDLVAHPSDALAWRRRLDAHPDLRVVLEHAGWPEATDADRRADWRRGLEALAEHPGLVVKLSGLGMVTHVIEPEALRPWVAACLETVGPERLAFGSNFPVESLFGTFAGQIDAYATLLAECTPAERDAIFAGTAERVYRL